MWAHCMLLRALWSACHPTSGRRMTALSIADLMPLLFVYAIVMVAAVLLAAWGRRWAERIAPGPPPIPPMLGPCEVAYLRSGMEESARLAILSLVLDGHIVLGEVSIPMW